MKWWLWPDGFVGDDPISKHNARWLAVFFLLFVFLIVCIAMSLSFPARGEFLALAPTVTDLPNPRLTPGKADPVLTKAKICAKGFRTGAIRDVDEETKQKVCTEYGLPAHCNKGEAYEIDHLIDIDNGGSNDIENLWPQKCSGPNNCHDKDALEVRLHDLVCAGKVTYEDAQREIATNWLDAYRRFVGASKVRK